MKVSAVITKPKVGLDNTKKTAFISGANIALGIIMGSVLYLICKDKLTGNLFDYFIDYTIDFSNKNKPEILSGLVLQNLIYYFFMLFFGTNVIGAPFVFLISFIKASGLGVLATYIYDAFSLKGIEYCLLVFFPGKFLLILSMVLLTQNCYYNALCIFRNIKMEDSRGVDLKKFTARSVLILMILLLASLVDFLTIISFSPLFDFS